MPGSNEKLRQLFYNIFKDKEVVISIKGKIICNTIVHNQRNKVNYIIAMVSTTTKWVSYYTSNFFLPAEVLLKKTSSYFQRLYAKRWQNLTRTKLPPSLSTQ